MNKIKNFFKWIFCNKKSLTGILSATLAALGGTNIIDLNTLPALMIKGFNITPILYYALTLAGTILGTTGKGFETISTFIKRVAVLNAQKEENAIRKEAEKEIALETKQSIIEQNKAEANTEATKAAELKAQQEAEHKAKVEAIKQQILASQNTPKA